jgi:hypothetical protein
MTLVRFLIYQYLRVLRWTSANMVKSMHARPEPLRPDSTWSVIARGKHEQRTAKYEAEVEQYDRAMQCLLRGDRLRDAVRGVFT